MNWAEPLTLVQLDGVKAASLAGIEVDTLQLTPALAIAPNPSAIDVSRSGTVRLLPNLPRPSESTACTAGAC